MKLTSIITLPFYFAIFISEFPSNMESPTVGNIRQVPSADRLGRVNYFNKIVNQITFKTDLSFIFFDLIVCDQIKHFHNVCFIVGPKVLQCVTRIYGYAFCFQSSNGCERIDL